jgi:hypothetical protein
MGIEPETLPTERMIKTRGTSRRNEEEGPGSIASTTPLRTWHVGKQRHGSLSAKWWIGDKSYLVSVDIWASVTIARPDTTAVLPVTDLITPYFLQMASGEVLPILKEALVKLTLGPVPTDILGVHCQYHWQVHPETGCLACPPCICGFGAPHAVSELCRSAIMMPQGTIAFVSMCEQKQQGGSNLIW